MSSKGKEKTQSPDQPLKGAVFVPSLGRYILKNRDEVWFNTEHQKWWNFTKADWVKPRLFLGIRIVTSPLSTRPPTSRQEESSLGTTLQLLFGIEPPLAA